METIDAYKRLKTALILKKKIWVLHEKYCPGGLMDKDSMEIHYYQSDRFAIDVIRDIAVMNKNTYTRAYQQALIEYDGKEDYLRDTATWNFYHSVKPKDYVCYVCGKELWGFGIVTGETVECEDKGDYIIHKRAIDWYKFDKKIEVSKMFRSPFLFPAAPQDEKQAVIWHEILRELDRRTIG